VERPLRGPVRGQRVARARRLRRLALRRAAVAGGLLLALGAGLAAAGAGLRWALTSPRFAVSQVEVVGVSRLHPDEVRRAAGVATGTNLFRVSPRAVADAVEALPLVRRAEVVRHFPDRVVIQVEERRPFTLVHAGRLHWIDEQGIGLTPETRAVPVALPVISGFAPEELATLQRPPSERVAQGISLVRLLVRSGHPLAAQISEIDVGRPEGPVLYTVEGVEVRLGEEDWEARLGRLAGVLAQVQAAGDEVRSIDLRFRDQVVLRPASR
jgi:cell division protein FtsQ